MAKGPRPVDLATADQWAVDTVVTEGVRMNLSEAELLLATEKLRERREMSFEQLSVRLHVSVRKAEALVRRIERIREAEAKAREMESVS
jgi:hypothetical protein